MDFERLTSGRSLSLPSVLSSHALAALAEFNAEKDAHQEKFAKLQAQAEANATSGGGGGAPLSMEAFTEDWNESQFWVRAPAGDADQAGEGKWSC